jgi:hypothetical protein
MKVNKMIVCAIVLLALCVGCTTKHQSQATGATQVQLTPEQEATREAIRVATIDKAKELGVHPCIFFKSSPNAPTQALAGSRIRFDIKNGRIGFDGDTLVSNAGPTVVDVDGLSWKKTLKEKEFILIKNGGILQSGTLD